MRWLYRTGVGTYHLGIRLAARIGHRQALAWVKGRQHLEREAILRLHRQGRPVLWLHAASLGEFEQGRPVLMELRERHPEWAVVVSFFSPSGYERCKDTGLAEVVTYLPPDGKENAMDWLELVRPRLAVFVKYEFWHAYLTGLRHANVPTFLIAGSFRPGQPFFRWFGSAWREMLACFTHFAVQTPRDAALLTKVGYDNVTVTGDPRLDRTVALAETPFADERLEAFCADGPVLFAGSVWPPDVELIASAWPRFRDRWKLVLAPHQLDAGELANWQSRFGAERYTEAAGNRRVLLLDTIGILSRAYRYGDVAYVGGAFGSGLHNTLEPLSYGLPVLFGPKYHKFPEAVAARDRGGAFCVESPKELESVWTELTDPASRQSASRSQLAYRDLHRGSGKRTAALISRLLMLLLFALPLSAQSWESADRMVRTLDGLYGKCNLMVALSGKEWRPGLCLAAAELEAGQTVSLEVTLEAGREYAFIASSEVRDNDLDLYLRDPRDSLLADDDKLDGTPIVEFTPVETGRFTLQLHLPDSTTATTFVALGILSSNGKSLSDREYRRVSTQFGAASGAVRAAGGAQRFGSGRSNWCVYGYLLDGGQGTTLSNLDLAPGRNFLAATGSDSVKDLDIYLADAELNIVRRDQDPDPYPMIEYDNRVEGPHLLRLEVESADRPGLILLGLFTR
ncbi:3-deoxy-D-manno-octulosonic-acid transferase [Neolewinella xylanilytica]|uniref:3-deoxy-D-manno-octulosonic acid transferase n=1 Tax=Neolewinella xylanilytica TaxID=1514080 RepID=A0A2S6IB02_9BACT|nr:glycosyltransferase N-terminal domain-containing protein [Neolewinella xylanilytica]PPK88684.1 3-deoxy-D-manno-octulosonic-acid transferase [Neolewinella xylanilytica]